MDTDNNTTVLELNAEDINDLGVRLGVERMQNQIANMSNMINQLLAYINMVDDRIAQLSGEGRVTRHVAPNFNADTGDVSFDVDYPGVPKDIKPPSFIAQERARRNSVTGLIKDGK